MSYQSKRESRTSVVENSSHKGYQQMSNDSNDISGDQTSKNSSTSSLPKYYPKDHEVTRWLINQMRCRNGLHHLVNLINIQPSLLSAYFEVYDQPEMYIDAKTGPGMPAYGIKTVLYLTPLAIAIYLRLKSVVQLLLSSSGTRIHAKARNEVDVNAICYVRRIKPRPGPFINDEYSTTQPAIIAIRREFFPAISLLMTSNFNPQSPVYIIEKLGTSRETTCWFVDILDFCIKLLNNRPGLDVISFIQCINCRVSTYDNYSSSIQCFYNPCVYDVKQINTDNTDKDESSKYIWCSVFRRLLRKGVNRSYSNCGNRLISLLEYIIEVGFFQQNFMPKGIIKYNPDLLTSRHYTSVGFKKITPEMINNLSGSEKDNAASLIGADRDVCLYLLTLWLERVRSRCLDRQTQRLFRLLTTSLAETELLHDFLFPPEDIDTNTTLHPYWLSVNLTKKQSSEQHLLSLDCLEEDTNEICELEPAQLNEIRSEIGLLAHSMNLIDYSEKLYASDYRKLTKTLPINGAFGDVATGLHESNSVYLQKSNLTRSKFLTCLPGKLLEESIIKVDENKNNKSNSNNIRTGCLLGHYSNLLLLSSSSTSQNQWTASGLNENTLKGMPKIERKSRSIQNRMYCMNRTRAMSMSPCSTVAVNTPSPVIDTKVNSTQTTNYHPIESSEHIKDINVLNSQLKPSLACNSNEIIKKQSNIDVEVQVDSLNKPSRVNDPKSVPHQMYHTRNRRVLKQTNYTKQ
ncbi:unnamed protein product [Trichobilharzia szidati]|nr:unnamed protein product [Trichobilharzia szidati]